MNGKTMVEALVSRGRETFTGRRVVITGIRDLHPASFLLVTEEVTALCEARPERLVFGGARGVDTVALLTVTRIVFEAPPEIVVVVPGCLFEQPSVAQRVVREAQKRFKDRLRLVELKLMLDDAASFRRRNDRMIDEALAGDPAKGGCLAFTDGAGRGGTHQTMTEAARRGCVVREVRVLLSEGGHRT